MKQFFNVLIFFAASVAFSQKQLTLEDAVTGQWTKFRPDQLDFVSWKGNSDTLVYLDKYFTLKGMVPGKAEAFHLIDASEMDQLLVSAGMNKYTYFPYTFRWADGRTIYFQHDGRLVFIDIHQKQIVHILTLDETAGQVEVHPGKRLAAFTIDNNIFLAGISANPIEITHDVNKGIVNGSDYVHRQEFGINKGMFWSPNGNYLAFYRKDETMVTEYPLVNSSARIAQSTPIRYPMAGMTSEEVTLGVYDVRQNKTVFMQTGEPKDQYLTAISWDPSEKYVYIGVLNRDQNHLKLNQYDAQTGAFVKTLFEEKNDRWVEPEHPLWFLKKTPTRFIWQSERDGFNHLYLYDVSGKLIHQLTHGEWEVTEILGTDEKEENLFFIRTHNRGLERHACMVNLKTQKITQLTTEPGTHSCQVNASGRYVFDQYNSINVPSSWKIIDLAKKHELNAATSANPLVEYALPHAEIVTIKAADGITDLNGRLIKPTPFDPNKKYPVVVYVYGGPHAQMVTNSWLAGARLWEYYMAQQGYVVFTLDNRGSAHRGFAFESVIHRQLGQAEMADQMKGVEYLKSLPFVDPSRIGVHGWSFGGFMTISLLVNYPGVFKVGVAGGPVTDWKYYEVMYGERYMDTPQTNEDGYNKTSVIQKASHLQDKLLIIHGAQDDVVVMQHSLEFINACIKARRQVDFFVYPDHKHNITGKDRVHLMQKITDYLNVHLKN